MNSKIIVMLFLFSLIIGCIDAPKSISANNSENENIQSETSKINVLSINDYLQYKLDYKSSKCSKEMTSLQCKKFQEERENTFYRNVDNKYIYDSGVVIDVRDDVSLETNLYDTTSSYVGTRNDGNFNVYLKDISDENKFKINKGEQIFFFGKVNIKSQTLYSVSIDKYVNLYDVKIGERQDVYTKDVAPTPTSGISKPTGITYHIDTSPPGKGVVYINDKISPTTGTLPPGTYKIKLVVGSKTYESSTMCAEKCSVELIQPVSTVTPTPNITPISSVTPIRPPW